MTSPRLQITPHTLCFRQPAGTSRGIYQKRDLWLLELSDNTRRGIGECAPLPQLSCDYEAVRKWMDDASNRVRLEEGLSHLLHKETEEIPEEILPFSLPSLRFATETALLHFRQKTFRLWDTPFSRNKSGILINGLIWMGTYPEMYARIREKINAGFRCLKLKIGAIGFEEELSLLQYIRRHFSAADLELRVDANGAFRPETASINLSQLADFQLHSIEQPLQAGQWAETALLCHDSSLPVALDEELIGIHTLVEKQRLLDTIHPRFIVLKPSLHGGIQGTREWIGEAEKRHIGWWLTSALESNIGLNAIAQLCALYTPSLPQGLGTGQLFTTNFPSPLYLKGDSLWYKD